jgi:uncharacterized protein (DUF362 family)/NAD-dependent dihydropyrimidine dehydrogenase PreA subunit
MRPIVALTKCGDYTDAEVSSSVSEALSLLGGMSAFVKEGDRVLLKPNLLTASTPDAAITTHPAILKAVVRQVQAAGGTPIIADSPGGPFTGFLLERAYSKAGWTQVAKETGAKLNFDTGSHQVSNPSGRIAKRLDVLDVLDDVDVVITLPKMKTHELTQFTGSTKILFGTIAGLSKAAYHMKFKDVNRFSDMLLDVLGYARPSLSIMDGVIGMEGDGPGTHGTPRKAGVILASSDSVALDVVATSVIGWDPLSVPIIRKAKERGLTSGRLQDVNVLGARVEDVRVAFKRPSSSSGGNILIRFISSSHVSPIVLRFVARYPAANSNCTGCGVCMQNCPASAITISGRARMDLGKCIRCYCCHEMCPNKAVDLKRLI